MASKKFQELQDMSLEDLRAELVETQKSYQKLRFDHALKGLDNPLGLRQVRRDVARLYTEVRRRELAEASPEVIASRSKIRNRRSK